MTKVARAQMAAAVGAESSGKYDSTDLLTRQEFIICLVRVAVCRCPDEFRSRRDLGAISAHLPIRFVERHEISDLSTAVGALLDQARSGMLSRDAITGC